MPLFKVIFKNAQGVDSGDEVRMLGKKIGYIRGTSIIGQNIVIDVFINNVLIQVYLLIQNLRSLLRILWEASF